MRRTIDNVGLDDVREELRRLTPGSSVVYTLSTPQARERFRRRLYSARAYAKHKGDPLWDYLVIYRVGTRGVELQRDLGNGPALVERRDTLSHTLDDLRPGPKSSKQKFVDPFEEQK